MARSGAEPTLWCAIAITQNHQLAIALFGSRQLFVDEVDEALQTLETGG